MSEDDFSVIEKLAEPLRKIIRAIKGQSIDDDIYSGLLNVRDPRERTRLSEHNVYGHSGMKLLAEWYPEEMGFWGKIADMEDIYFIPLEGLQRTEAIMMARAKTEMAMASPLTVTVPQIQTTPQPQEAKPIEEKKKGGLFHRGA